MEKQQLIKAKEGAKLLPAVQALFADDPAIDEIRFGGGRFIFELAKIDTAPFMSHRGRFDGSKYLQASDHNRRVMSAYVRMTLKCNGFENVKKVVLQ